MREQNILEASGFLDFTGDIAFIDSRPYTWWVEEFGLPLHIRSAEIIKGNINAFKHVLRRYYPNSNIHFAAKVFPYPEMLHLVVNEGVGVDAASYHEMRCALEAGVPGAHIGLNGNAKEDFMIEAAIHHQMVIIADNIEELKFIEQIASNLKRKANVILRVSGFNVGDVTAEDILTSNNWTKFGEHIEYVKQSIYDIIHFPHIELQGFHAHVGSQITSLEPFSLVLGELIGLGHLLNAAGQPCKMINIGGGYPISYFTQSQWLDFLNRIKAGNFLWHDKLKKISFNEDGTIKYWEGEKFYTDYPKEKMLEALLCGSVRVNGKLFQTVQALQDLGNPLLVIEPGRSIVGDSGVTLANVSHTKKVNLSQDLTILEMGVTNLGEGFFGPSARQWKILNDHGVQDMQPFETFLAGNLCYSGDVFSPYKCLLQRKPKRDDIVLAYMTGAYDQYFFASNANAFPRPPQILSFNKNHMVMIKKRESYEEIMGAKDN